MMPGLVLANVFADAHLAALGWATMMVVGVAYRMLRIDFGVWHAASAGVSLIAAASIGMTLLLRPTSPTMLRAAAAYGVLGLVGFLGQMVVAMEAQLLPTVTWFWASPQVTVACPQFRHI
jgi:hypothetical protein